MKDYKEIDSIKVNDFKDYQEIGFVNSKGYMEIDSTKIVNSKDQEIDSIKVKYSN